MLEAKFVPELSWKERELPQKERTKHVHGLHPYLGKYPPQVVAYLLRRYFKEGETILDPFVGSGTTLVESNLNKMDSVGVDVSEFNILLCKVKTDRYNLSLLESELADIVRRVKIDVAGQSSDVSLDSFLSENPIASRQSGVNIAEASEYLRTWYHPTALYPLLVFRSLIGDYHYQNALKVLLTRIARSSRLAPHYELDSPKHPFTKDYHCHKHNRICHPTSNAIGFMERYSVDTFERIATFQKLRSDKNVQLIAGDARTASYPKVSGVITSPPYIGLIDYHEQHRYAYELLGLRDKSDLEIGAKKAKSSKRAVQAYKESIAAVLSRIASQATTGPIIFVVNDKRRIYEEICGRAKLTIRERLARRVDRRTGRRSQGEFFEDIIVMNAQ